MIFSPYFLNLVSFLVVILLAAAVVGTAAWRPGLPVSGSVIHGSALFLVQFIMFVALAGLGASLHLSQMGAIALGLVAVLHSSRAAQHSPEDQRERT